MNGLARLTRTINDAAILAASAGNGKDATVLVVAESSREAAAMLDEIAGVLGSFVARRTGGRERPRLHLINGTVLHGLPATDGALRGRTAHAVLYDHSTSPGPRTASLIVAPTRGIIVPVTRDPKPEAPDPTEATKADRPENPATTP